MGLGDFVGGLLGGDAGKDEMQQSLKLSKEAAEQLKNLYVPTVEEQKILLQNPELAGLLAAEQLGPSAMENVSTDPRLKNAQMKALEQLAGLSQTGLGVEDQAAFNDLRKQSGAMAQSEQAKILQNAAATGTLDSGNAFLAQLNAGQQQANRLQDAGQAQAAAAAAARREALNSYANMSSQMANQDWSQRSQVANARDSINQFNAQNRQGVNQYNLGQQQNINNQKSANANQQEMYNKGLIQQRFQNQLGKATGTASQLNNLASNYAQQGQAAAQGQAAMTSGLLNAGLTLGTAAMTSPSGAAGVGASGKGAGGAVPGSYDDFYMNKVK